MATLKEHQNAMVDLLANGSAIPASAARLAHAMHDVLGLLLEGDSEPHRRVGGFVDSTKSYVVGETPLEAQAFDLCEQIEELKLRLLGAPVTYCGFPKIVDLTECSEVAVIPLRYIDHIIARIGSMTGVEQGDISKVVSAIVAISPKP